MERSQLDVELQVLNLTDFQPGMRVLDVGCGTGREMQQLAQMGCEPIGIDVCPDCIESCQNQSLTVQQAFAESLPFPDASFDGAISQVVLPLTDEARVIREVARVLKPGGLFCHSCHGSGYYVKRLIVERSWKKRFYCLRSLVNTWVYRLTGRRLPSFYGDTIYQSRRRLNRYYRKCGLTLVDEAPAVRFLGLPVFIYHTTRKTVTPVTDPPTATSESEPETAILNKLQPLTDFSKRGYCQPERESNVLAESSEMIGSAASNETKDI